MTGVGDWNFEELVRACTKTDDNPDGIEPYDFQRRVADEGLPDLLVAPTGAGKTLTVVLGWLYRRRFHPDQAVRASTPHWLVICEPMRTLVEQVEADVIRWITASGQTDLDVHVFMGGEPSKRADWRNQATNDAVIIGTQDMLLSRALNRGFGSSRYLWPVEFAVLNNGAWWVFDEIQLMGAAVPTSRQLEAFRSVHRAVLPHGSTWMSATVDPLTLVTVDNPRINSVIELSEADRSGQLAKRLQAGKTMTELTLPADVKQRAKAISESVLQTHVPGTLSLVILNTVATARDVHAELAKRNAPDIVLVHSRFRPGDRRAVVDRVKSPVDAQGLGRIVVSTQVVEAGMDLDAASLTTEAAPWPSVVQRLGRCNRAGNRADAKVRWFLPARLDKPLPYSADDVEAAIETLRSLEGQAVVPDGLADLGPTMTPVLHPVLRMRDLLQLFDTMPDLSGADVDVAPYVRDTDGDSSVYVAWRDLGGVAPAPNMKRPGRDELCPVPIGEFRKWTMTKKAWVFRHLDGEWDEVRSRAVRPNDILLVEASNGGYHELTGWNENTKGWVTPVIEPVSAHVDAATEQDEAVDADDASFVNSWVSLRVHLPDTRQAAEQVLAALTPNLSTPETAAIVRASLLHDLGKAHDTFQDTMMRAAKDAWPTLSAAGPLAKSAGSGLRHKTKFFRHEVATALALLSESRDALDDLPQHVRFLVVYLTAAHHGKVRMSLRPLPGEPTGTAFGITHGDQLPSVDAGDMRVAGATLLLMPYLGLGVGEDGIRPWAEQTKVLLDQFGPFVLAWFESIVRFSDWRASAQPSEVL